MLRIEGASHTDVTAVAHRMRERDVVEFLATSDAADRIELEQQLGRRYGMSTELIVARYAGDPVAVGGLIQHRPNVCTLLFFATDAFPLVALGLTRFITRSLFPAVKDAGCHRIECISYAGYTDAHRWIGLLGLSREAEFEGYGRAGETFVQFAWVK